MTLESGAHEVTGRLLAADSFRVRGTVRGGEPGAHVGAPAGAAARGFTRHIERFARTAHAAWLDVSPEANPAEVRGRVSAFLDSARTRLARSGDGFPRFELWEPDPSDGIREPRLALAIRKLPQLQLTIALRSGPSGPLPRARSKGPNIARYAALRHELGAEPLLLDREGRVLEGATTSLIWWSRETHRGAVSALPDRVPSVTEALIRDAAELEPRVATLNELLHHEVWAVNALHGIRPVSHIDGARCAPHDKERLAHFREMLDRRWEPITDPRARR
ncbi:aminotransferase class IV [Leucobacter sp. NPDC077196]|uniref:aminotransferase class IV n=1 Tax=Leucobacter sp. NPDC077196 TaxID=3154959 RepID=UPI00341C5152